MTCFLMILGFFICIFEELMIYSVCDTFLERRFCFKYQDFVIIAFLSSILFLANQLHHPLLNVAVALMTSLTIALLLFTGLIREQLYCCSLACMVIFSTEHVGFRLLGGELSRYGFLSTILATIMIKLTSFFILQVICHYAKNKKIQFTGSRITTWCFFLYPLTCFILLIGLRYSHINVTLHSFGEKILIVGLFLLLFSNMLLFFLYDYIISITEQVRKHELSQTKDSLTQQHFAILQETNTKYASLLHDVNNYIQTIQTLQLQNDSLKIKSISNSLMNEISDISSQTFCSSPVINAILHEKQQSSLQKQLDFRVFVEPCFPTPDIPDNDLISLLCNLLDNAMEAAIQCTDGFVDVKFFVNGTYQIIKIQNPYKDHPKHDQNRFFTSKPDTQNHGFGIRRVEAIAEKHHGTLKISMEESLFTAVVLLPVKTAQQ